MRELVCGIALSLLSLVSACGETGDSASRGNARASLKSGATLTTHGDCGVGQPQCPANTQCAVVSLDTGVVGPSCVAANICDLLACGGGSCAILESFPAQVICGK